MIELPCDLGNEQVQAIAAHAADASELPLQDSPESLDVVGMYPATHQLAPVVIDPLVHEPAPWEHAVHLEAIGIDGRTGSYPFGQDGDDAADVELALQDLDMDLARIAVENAHNRQLFGSVAPSAGASPDMEPLVLPLAPDVCLVHFDRPAEHVRNVRCHAFAQVRHHLLDSTVTDSRLVGYSPYRPFPEKGADDLPPLAARGPDAGNLPAGREFATAGTAFPVAPTDLPCCRV